MPGEPPPDSFGLEKAEIEAKTGSVSKPSQRYWLHALLFLLTGFSTTLVGTRLAQNFEANRPAFELESDFVALGRILTHPRLLADGLPFAITLLTILLAHELGHYWACRYYGVQVSLPYFLPAPTVIGTLGAFIRIRSPIYSRVTLFDVGVAGPLAGFLFVIPALGMGLAWSKVIPGIANQGDILMGTPLIVRLWGEIVFPGAPVSDIYLHPVARAAWVGVIATALNLLPIGQSDGGHIVYAFVGGAHRWISRFIILALIPLGLLYWYGWIVWAALFLLLGMRHPPTIYDDTRLGAGRSVLGLLALLILALSFAPTPIRTGSAL
jgi:membrane-associated protease RseP (regulator of RpoE activity)